MIKVYDSREDLLEDQGTNTLLDKSVSLALFNKLFEYFAEWKMAEAESQQFNSRSSLGHPMIASGYCMTKSGVMTVLAVSGVVGALAIALSCLCCHRARIKLQVSHCSMGK